MTPPILMCLCSHPRRDHDTGNGNEECRRDLHPACGCGAYRLDPRSRLQDETAGLWLDDIARAGPAIWAAKNTARGGAA